MREKENPKVPFYTLEVEPDGTIRQKRAEFNRQNKDIDKVTSFLTLWQKEIQKRLTQKDRKSTEESRKLRHCLLYTSWPEWGSYIHGEN